jgi:non-specific serine/threonine protein kinase
MQESRFHIVRKEPAPRREVPNNLPAQARPLVGREQEVESACRLLEKPEVRLLTLVGPGGVGKTRLALQVAEELLELFPDGVYFVELAAIIDPNLVAPAVASVLPAEAVAERAGAAVISLLKEYLRDKKVLLVLDNFEQIVQAGGSVSDLVVECPQLKVIVTSRSALRLGVEHQLTVDPLALPRQGAQLSVSSLSQYGAVELFVQRARAVNPDFELTAANGSAVVDVCRRVDGLPLAIELVAAHARLLPPGAILARLAHPLRLLKGGPSEAPSRQQTMRDTIEWSYKLLDEGEQALFRRMAVFVGGCTVRAAEAVCNEAGDIEVEADQPAAIAVLEGMEALADNSLVRRRDHTEEGDPRVSMLETVREYALEQLAASGEMEAMHRQHARYYSALAGRLEGDVRSSDVPTWMGRVGPEHGNLRAAMRWLLEQEGPAEREAALRLILGLEDFWGRFYSTGEIQQWLETALGGSERRTTLLRVRGLRYAARLSYLRADYDRAEEWAEEALVGARELNERVLIAASLNHIGLMAVFRGNYEAARTMLEEARDLFREEGDGLGVGAACLNLGEIARYQGDYARAEACYRESLEIFKAVGRAGGVVQALSSIGHVLVLQGKLGEARTVLLEALGLAREMDARKIAAEVLTGLSSLMLTEKGGSRVESEWVGTAVRLMGIASSIVEQSGRQMEPVDQEEFDRNVGEARATLGDEAYDAAWAEGRSMTLEQAVALAAQSVGRAEARAMAELPGGLTRREAEVTGLVARGLTNEAIAQELVLSERTVEMHVSNALHKLGLSTRTQLAAWAVHNGL